VRFLAPTRRETPERLLWSRDIRFVHRLAAAIRDAQLLDLESGVVLVADAAILTEMTAAEVARIARNPAYGLVAVDPTIPEPYRYLVAMSTAVQQSGIADRIGMDQSTNVVQTKLLDYFFTLGGVHQVHLQPIVELASGELHEYECLFRPTMPMLPQSIGSIVQAAIDTGRSVEFDLFVVGRTLERLRKLELDRAATGAPRARFAINLTPTSLLDPRFEAHAFAELVTAAGLTPRQITVECTEQEAVADLAPLQKQVKALRKLGFGFAVDDAGAGYASFTLIAALRPSVIKIDREIVHRIASDDAKQALVEAFVSFGRRIRARLLAEGIETRRDLATLRALGVELGQGYLLGKPALEPQQPKRARRLVEEMRDALDDVREGFETFASS
jgi:EAL domain-containing protein (putative c-di-GMP-specific phosphodiesterase class I)